MTITDSESYYEHCVAPLPDFSTYGYQVVQQLGHNNIGERTTYLATEIATGQAVVIKQFSFGRPGANWSGFKAYEREIQVLRSLNHAGIPRYLDCFETKNSFCLLQEYKDAQPLSIPRSFTSDEIKQIAVSVLEILVYLQSLVPPVIHRDIKPENILVSDGSAKGDCPPDEERGHRLDVYLVDFGFARIGGNDLAMSSVVVGTTGFMPPEQILNQDLSAATDLYSLGATLICLLLGIQSASLNKFIDETYTIDTEKLLHTSVDLRFKQWLRKMVAPRRSDRYSDAMSALVALKAIALGSLLPDWVDTSNIWREKEPKNAELALVQTAHEAVMTSIQLGFFYTVLPLLPRVVFPVSKADAPFQEILVELIQVWTQVGSQLAYVVWNVTILVWAIKSSWDLVSERDYRSSGLAAIILGSSLLIFKFFALVLKDAL